MVDINTQFSSLTSSGNLIFSGLASGINSQATIDAIMEAKRIPLTTLEDKITLNNERVSAFEEFKSKLTTLGSTLNDLRGNNSIGATDVFDSKLGFATAAAASGAPAGHTPSEAGALVGVTTSSTAESGTHSLIINQLATAHQLRSDVISSKTDDMATLGVTAGTFDLNGETISVAGTDTILDVRDKINASNANVTATIVSSSSTEHYLVLTSSDTGATNSMSFGAGTATSDDLGLTNAGAIKNELRTAQDANFDLNGITGITRASNTVDDAIDGVTLSLFAAESDTELTISIEDDLNTIKTAVADFVEAYNEVRSFIDDQRTERAREDTNGDGTVNGDDDASFGELAFDANLRQISTRLNEVVAAAVPGLDDGFQSLSQVGVVMNSSFELEVDDDILDNKLLSDVDAVRKIFAFDFSSSDSRFVHLSHTGETQMNSPDGETIDPYYVNIDGTNALNTITGGNITTSSGAGTAGDGSVTIKGATMTATDTTGAEGLKILFTGGASSAAATDVEINFTRGIADQLYFFINEATKSDGTIDDVVDQFEARNDDIQEQINTLNSRLERVEQNLQDRFVAMETALAELESMRTSLSQFFSEDDS